MIRWDTDDRPATLYTRAYMLGMRVHRDKQAFEGAERTLRIARQRQRRGDVPPSRLTRLLTDVEASHRAGMTVWTARPRRGRPVARVVYMHGGGYIHPLTADYWRLVRSLSAAPAEVVVPAYPLAPDATVDDVLPRLLEVAAQPAGGGSELPTILMGDSAGGALAIVTALQLRDRPGPRPAAVIALSPWLDATLDEAAVRDLEPSDPMLAESGLRAAGRWWAGVHGPSDPHVSPARARLDGLPPVDLFIGSRDILRPAVEGFAERAEAAGVDLHVRETPAMFHVWMTRAVPEGRRTRRALAELVRHRAASGGLQTGLRTRAG
jgi:acetyl esterase/lipase